jgi:hypothetical protein
VEVVVSSGKREERSSLLVSAVFTGQGTRNGGTPRL